MARKSRPYEVGLYERLREPSHAMSYINAAAEDSIEGFLLALRDCAEATKGMSRLAVDAEKNRENLYRMLAKDGNPRLRNLSAVLQALGFRISVSSISGQQSPRGLRGGEGQTLGSLAIDPSLPRIGPHGIGSPPERLGDQQVLANAVGQVVGSETIRGLNPNGGQIGQPAKYGHIFVVPTPNAVQAMHP